MKGHVDLFDVVPWEYGFVHSGTVAWLLEREQYAGEVLAAVVGAPWSGDVRVTSPPQREARVGRGAADLSFTVAWHGTVGLPVAFETKVHDHLSEPQIAGYRASGYQPLLYMPGLTGMLAVANPTSEHGEAKLTGEALCSALAPMCEQLPLLIAGYLDAVRHEARRFEIAHAAARGEDVTIPAGRTPESAMHQIAWIVAVQRELQRRCAADAASTIFPVGLLATRDVAFDRGFFWKDTHTSPAAYEGTGDIGFYIDVLVVKASGERMVVIKAGFDSDALESAYALSQDAGPPDGGLWVRGQRRFHGTSVGCWKASVNDLDAVQTADVTVRAATWIAQRAAW